MRGAGNPRYTEIVAIEAVIEEALKLSVEERAEVISRLLDSLEEGPEDPDHEAAWTEVLDRRLREIREGRVELIDAADAMVQARAAAGRRR
jgi:putative addiction module component (TIGR02574 family)